MKYIKFGTAIIVSQNINAGCCGNANNNADDNEEEKKAIDEISKYFGVSKDKVIFTYTTNASNFDIEDYDNNNDIKNKKNEISEEVEDLQGMDNDIFIYEFTKIIFEENKVIYVYLLSHKHKIKDGIEPYNKEEISNAMKNKEKITIYYEPDIGTYRKK